MIAWYFLNTQNLNLYNYIIFIRKYGGDKHIVSPFVQKLGDISPRPLKLGPCIAVRCVLRVCECTTYLKHQNALMCYNHALTFSQTAMK